MNVVDAGEAPARFRELLAEVEGGATITIVADGSPVAELVPPADRKKRVPTGHASRSLLNLQKRWRQKRWGLQSAAACAGRVQNSQNY